MKKFVVYTLLFFIISNCNSKKILSDKIINKKWDINYVESNLGNNPIITNQDKESLITKDYKSKNLVQETEQFLASNDDLINYNKKKLSTISKESIIYQRFTKIDSIVNSNNLILKEKEIYEESQKALKFSFLAVWSSLISLLLGFISVVTAFLSGSEYLAPALILFFGMIPFTLGFVSLYIVNSIFRKLKKKGEKIKNQEKKIKRAIYASIIITLPLLLITSFVIFWAIDLVSWLF